MVTWKYAYEPCARVHGIYESFLHDTAKWDEYDELPGDRLELMYCTSCEAYLWGTFTIHEEPW